MKNLIYIFLILPFIAFANYIPLNLVGGDAPTVFSISKDCEDHYKTSCVEIPFGYDAAYHVVTDEMIDGEPTGQKIVIEDADKKAAYETKIAQDEAQKAALAKALQAMNAGREIIAKMAIRNVQKGLTAEQVAQFLDSFKDVKGMLETGSLTTAKAAINAITPDGVVTTESDKEFLITEINAFLGQ